MTLLTHIHLVICYNHRYFSEDLLPTCVPIKVCMSTDKCLLANSNVALQYH